MTVQRVASGAPWEDVVGYCRVVRAGDLVFVSGTTGTREGLVVEGGVAAQTAQALANVVAALESVGATTSDVVRTRVYVTDIDSWEAVGRVHGEFFGATRPASAMVEVSRLIDPAMLVEVEADAVVGA
ncbi:MAG: putative Endoribonuclease [Klenkia sp.]|nr:putative Endoribonuclease [Klenkia sp.]